MSHEHDLGRRTLLRSGIVLAATAFATACEGNDAGLVRSEAGAGATQGGPDGAAATGPLADSDAATLNALLATEYGAIDAYAAGASILQAPSATDPLASLAPVLLAVAQTFHDQHVFHAEALRSAVAALGGHALETSSVTFVAPAGFTPSVLNVLKLACNAERAAAISYVGAVGQLSSTANRFLAASIEGDETQHFMVLYAVVQGLVDPGAALSALTASTLVPAQFVASVGLGDSLDSIADFDVTM